jgi:hypothetical protein
MNGMKLKSETFSAARTVPEGKKGIFLLYQEGNLMLSLSVISTTVFLSTAVGHKVGNFARKSCL